MKRMLAKRLLWVAATDATFERMTHGERPVLSGRCIHCRKRHMLTLDGQPISRATLEHIQPRNHGGDDRAMNLAIACASCNSAKGRRLDCRRATDPDLQRVVTTLSHRRAERWRDPPDDWTLGDPPDDWDLST